MRMKEAIRLSFAERGEPVITEYVFFLLLKQLYSAGTFRGEHISTKVKQPRQNEFEYYLKVLLRDRYLRRDDDFTGSAYRVSDVPDGSAEEITALVDPFCYISHLSAMQRYGLTTRIPDALTLTTIYNWREAAIRKEQQDYGLFPEVEEFRVPLRRVHFPEKVRKRLVALHTSKREPLIKPIKGSAARIAAIGEVFVQMLDRPELCGGMAHVLDVWTEHASTYLPDIIRAVDHSPEKIIKVRAGYILQERLSLQDPGIEKWVGFAQRGGSRLLDPTKPYVSRYSEKWMISLNVDAAEGSP